MGWGSAPQELQPTTRRDIPNLYNYFGTSSYDGSQRGDGKLDYFDQFEATHAIFCMLYHTLKPPKIDLHLREMLHVHIYNTAQIRSRIQEAMAS
jgi:hypothetical protein